MTERSVEAAEEPLILHDEHFPECAAERDGLSARVAELTEQRDAARVEAVAATEVRRKVGRERDDLAAALQRVREHCDCIHGHGADSAAAEIERLRGIIGGIRVVAALGGATPEPAKPTFDQLLSDPHEQFDKRSELLPHIIRYLGLPQTADVSALMASIEEYRNAPPCAASAPKSEPQPATCEHGATMRHQFRMYGIGDDWSDCPGPGPGLPEEGKQQ